jgi:sugar phosphate isomerase/epimerase
VPVFVSASTRCFSDKSFGEACYHIEDMQYDKVELWFDENSNHLKPSDVAADPERFYARYRELTRLTPIAFCLENEVSPEVFAKLCKLAKLFRITQITIPSSPLGTPFNAEIDRLRACLRVGSQDGVLVSIKTKVGTLAEDPNTAIELCQASPGIGLTVDPSQFICRPRGSVDFEQTLAHAFHLHLRDTLPDQLQVKIGLGEIEYSKLVTTLERHKYNRALSVELYPELMDVADRPVEMRKMRLLLESLL